MIPNVFIFWGVLLQPPDQSVLPGILAQHRNINMKLTQWKFEVSIFSFGDKAMFVKTALDFIWIRKKDITQFMTACYFQMWLISCWVIRVS